MTFPRITFGLVFRVILIAGIIAVLWIAIANLMALIVTKGHIFTSINAPKATVAIVLGAGIRPDGTPSDMLRDRLLTAVDLYNSGNIKKILASGDHGTDTHDEVNAMKTFLLAHEVKPEDIFLDHAGFDTYDTMYRARDIFGVADAIIITQSFHIERALFIARSLHINAEGVSADRMEYLGIPYLTAREWLANAKALLQIVVHAKPKFLGDPILITGDGEVTWDEK